uniref:Uncharacterized protein n=1 Tax=candidate division CPR3 bacterium TaxID=2268181 RepID=A0A7C4LZY9_UNCC3
MALKDKLKTKKENTKNNIPKNIVTAEELIDYIRFNKNPWRNIFFSFLRGTAYGLGIVLGTAIVLTIIIYISNYFINYPIIGEWLKMIGESMTLSQ